MKRFRDDDNQKKFALLLSELSDLDDVFDAEVQFCDTLEVEADVDDAQFQNNFTGLKSLNDIRWNFVFKVSKCYLDNSSELKNCVCFSLNFISQRNL